MTETAYISREHWMPHYKKRRLPLGNYVLISPAGDWVLPEEIDLNQLESIRISHELFLKLENNGLIITENNSDKIFERYRYWNEKKYTGTALHIFEITKNCNLQCTYCHTSAITANRSNNRHMSVEVARKIIDFVFQTPSRKITIEFQGGEALLNFDVIKFIVQYANKKNREYGKEIDYALVSNLISINKDHCTFINEHNINVCTSLDGPQYLHDKQRVFKNGKGSFLSLISGLKTLSDNGVRAPGILTVITKNTISKVYEIIDMYKDLNLKRVCFIYVNSLGYANDNWEKVGISIEEELENYRKVLDYMFDYWRDGYPIHERKINLALTKIMDDQDIFFTDFRNPCGMAIGQMAYGYDGNIYTCDEARGRESFLIGNVHDNNYKTVINSNKTTALVSQSLPNYPECSDCAYRTYCCICPVINHELGISEKTCEKDIRCRFSRMIFDYCFEKIYSEPELIKAYLIYEELMEKRRLS